jgi:monoamine oxidase
LPRRPHTAIDLGLSIAWHHVPYQMGGWADWEDVNPVHYETLLAPEGRVIVAGDQVSYLPGWQEGAMLSAQHVIRQIMPRETRPLLKTTSTGKRTAPGTRAMTEGIGETRKE